MPSKGFNQTIKDNMDYISNGAYIGDIQFRTGLLGLNFAISSSGFIPGGSLIELVGEPGTGKSTLALDIIYRAQQDGHLKMIEIPNGKATRLINAVYLDFERSYTPEYAAKLGINIDNVLVVRTPVAEQSYNIMDTLIQQGCQLFVIDSVAAMVTQDEQDRAFDEPDKLGTESKLLKQVMKKFLVRAFDVDALIIVINQFRANISTMARTEKKPFGARIIHHNVRAIIELIKISAIPGNIGAKIKAHVSKSRLGPTGKITEFELLYGQGCDFDEHNLTLAENYDIVTKKGTAWYEYKGITAQGKAQAVEKFPMHEIAIKVEQAMKGERVHETNTSE